MTAAPPPPDLMERTPWTAAGRALLSALRKDYRPGTLGYQGADSWIPAILAIEAEAGATAAVPLDVERLREAHRLAAVIEGDYMEAVVKVYARLSADEVGGT